jgi:hypothetical protein
MRTIMRLRIENTTTIEEVVEKLTRPEEYVRRVLVHMDECKKQFGEPSVRIGVSGKGRAPHYQIEYPNECGVSQRYGTYRGSSDKRMLDEYEKRRRLSVDLAALFTPGAPPPPPPLPPPDYALVDRNWSSRTTGRDEVAALLGRLRSQKR